jgi:hypothetical protein
VTSVPYLFRSQMAKVQLLEAVFLGVVQGLTEFLPVSSSGHLLLSQYFLGMDQERFGLSFDAAIHTGTLLAVVLFFRGDLLAMARAFLGSLPHPDFADAQVRTAYLILLATGPGALIGFFFEDFFATEVRSPWVVVINLVFVGALFLVAEAMGRKTESALKLGPLGGLRDRAGAGGGPSTRGLALGGDDHLRAVFGPKARGGGPLLFPDERASDGGSSGLEPRGCYELD